MDDGTIAHYAGFSYSGTHTYASITLHTFVVHGILSRPTVVLNDTAHLGLDFGTVLLRSVQHNTIDTYI